MPTSKTRKALKRLLNFHGRLKLLNASEAHLFDRAWSLPPLAPRFPTWLWGQSGIEASHAQGWGSLPLPKGAKGVRCPTAATGRWHCQHQGQPGPRSGALAVSSVLPGRGWQW